MRRRGAILLVERSAKVVPRSSYWVGYAAAEQRASLRKAAKRITATPWTISRYQDEPDQEDV